MMNERKHLMELVKCFRSSVINARLSPGQTPVPGVIIPGNEAVKNITRELIQKGLDIRPVLYPAVPKGQERLRIVLHAFNSQKEPDFLLNCLKNSL